MDHYLSPLKVNEASHDPKLKISTPNLKQTSLVHFLSPTSITSSQLNNKLPTAKVKSKKMIKNKTISEHRKVKSVSSPKAMELKGWLQSNDRNSLKTQNQLQLGEQNNIKEEDKTQRNNKKFKKESDKTQRNYERKRKYIGKVQKEEDGKKLKPNDDKMKELTEKVVKETKKSLLLKYGVNVPTYKEIIKHHKDLEKKKKQLKELFENSFEVPETKHINLNFDLPETDNSLDCKSLTIDDLKSAYDKHSNYINSFYKDLENKCQAQPLVSFDKTNIGSMIIFSQEQKLILAKLIQKFVVHDDNQIIFKVLLPQLCLRIFMDQHNMSEEKAIDYLKIRKCD